MENAWASSLWVSRLSERVDEGKVASQESKCYSKCYTKRESFESEQAPIVGNQNGPREIRYNLVLAAGFRLGGEPYYLALKRTYPFPMPTETALKFVSELLQEKIC
jgi:hypothetical protein